MTAKEYLNQIYVLEVKYQSKLEQAQDMRLLAESTGAIRYDKVNVVSSPDGDTLLNAIIRIVTVENEATRIAVELAETKDKIIEMIMSIDDEKLMRILCLKYVRHKKLTEVAEIIHMDYDWTKKLHLKALGEFEEKFSDELKEHTETHF